MRSLVTGGAGFIGSHVAAELLKLGHEVVMLDDFSGGRWENIPDTVLTYIGSITDRKMVDLLFERHRFDYVFHLAAYAAEGLSHFIRAHNYENNVLGSMNLINAAIRHDVKRFVFTSSVAVYGHPERQPVVESDPPTPIDPYGIAKYAVELDLKAAHEMFGLDYTIFRPHNVYGPHQNLVDKYRNVVGIFMRQHALGEPFGIFGDGTQVREFSYIDDVAPHIARSAEMPNARNTIFNIGSSIPYTILELAQAIDTNWNVTYMPPRNEVKSVRSAHTLATSVFGNLDTIQLPEGIRRMTEWARDAGVQQPTRAPAIEVTKNLPPSWA